MKGLVWWGVNNIFQVDTAQGTWECRFKGKVLKDVQDEYNPLCPGDWVEVEADEAHPGKGMILSRYPRTNQFSRWNRKRKAPQTIAANLDLLVLVTCPDSPPFRPRFLDRALLMASVDQIPPMILVNKTDQGIDEAMADRLKDYGRLGIQLAFTSVEEQDGLEELKAFLQGKVVAFIGQSGVGKSTLLNAIHPQAQQRTGEVSLKFNRGIHTTNFGTFLPWESGGGIIDTPGIRELEVFGVDPGDLGYHFPEIAPFAEHCGFQPCTHTHEPGCAVKPAVEAGKIHPDRWESFQRILEELRQGEYLG